MIDIHTIKVGAKVRYVGPVSKTCRGDVLSPRRIAIISGDGARFGWIYAFDEASKKLIASIFIWGSREPRHQPRSWELVEDCKYSILGEEYAPH